MANGKKNSDDNCARKKSPEKEINTVKDPNLDPAPPEENVPLNSEFHPIKRTDKGNPSTKRVYRRSSSSKVTSKLDAKKKDETKKPNKRKRTSPPPPPSDNSSSSSSNSSDSESGDDDVPLKKRVKLLTKQVESLTNLVQHIYADKPSAINNNACSSGSSGRQGESFLSLNTQPEHNHIAYTSGLPAGENLPDRIKQKIWSNKYVDFFTLLYPDSDNSYCFSLNQMSSTPTLDLTPKKKRTLNEREWNKAWDEFLATHTRRFPEDLLELITYGKFIREMMVMGYNWNFYDTNFRKDREHSLCKWSTIRIDLQIQASQMKKTPESFPVNNQNNQHVPVGYCFKFHARNLRCESHPCRYKHNCPRCNKTHPAFFSCSRQAPESIITSQNQHTFRQNNPNPTPNPSQTRTVRTPAQKLQ